MKRLLTTLVILTGLLGGAGAVWADAQSNFAKGYEAIKDGDKPRMDLLLDYGIEIGTSFGLLHGKIWRIGTMGHVCRKPNILRCLDALETVLRRNGYTSGKAGAGVDAAYDVYG
jgi:aspartate aminotransferase-like enzyme